MTRLKVTSSDIFARLAKGECANFSNGGCQGRTPCGVIAGEACEYFASYVQPLLDHPEFNAKYAREAKVTLALNPKAKIIKKRRQAGDPALQLADAPTPPANTAAVRASKPVSAPKTPALKPSKVNTKPVVPTVPRSTTAKAQATVRTVPQTPVTPPLEGPVAPPPPAVVRHEPVVSAAVATPKPPAAAQPQLDFGF